MFSEVFVEEVCRAGGATADALSLAMFVVRLQCGRVPRMRVGACSDASECRRLCSPPKRYMLSLRQAKLPLLQELQVERIRELTVKIEKGNQTQRSCHRISRRLCGSPGVHQSIGRGQRRASSRWRTREYSPSKNRNRTISANNAGSTKGF